MDYVHCLFRLFNMSNTDPCLNVLQNLLFYIKYTEFFYSWVLKRSVTIKQEMCPIRAEISTHKHLGKCTYLLFV